MMAAAGMGGGAAWVVLPRGEREALALESVKLAIEFGGDANAVNIDGKHRARRGEGAEVRVGREVSRRAGRRPLRPRGHAGNTIGPRNRPTLRRNLYRLARDRRA